MFHRTLPALVLLALLAPASARAGDAMRHRHEEHALEGYFLGAVGLSLGGRPGVGGVAVEAAWLQPLLGVGFELPTGAAACLGISGLGFEVLGGPTAPLDPALPAELQIRPGLLLEMSGNFPLQLFARGSLVLRSGDGVDPGVAGALLLGWYTRPMAFRAGVTWEAYPELASTFAGLRLEVVWLGEDPPG